LVRYVEVLLPALVQRPDRTCVGLVKMAIQTKLKL
jgi:hypothetical protein